MSIRDDIITALYPLAHLGWDSDLGDAHSHDLVDSAATWAANEIAKLRMVGESDDEEVKRLVSDNNTLTNTIAGLHAHITEVTNNLFEAEKKLRSYIDGIPKDDHAAARRALRQLLTDNTAEALIKLQAALALLGSP